MGNQQMTTPIRVPYGMTVHGEEEIAAVTHVLRTSTQMGVHVREFEDSVAKLFEKKHGIMVNSGSSALLLAAEILGLPPGSEVITPALTFATTVGCLLKNQLVPAFVDVEDGTYCIDPAKVEAMITPNTRAMCIPNLIGNVCDWERLGAIAKKYNLKVIEDSADTLGGTLNKHSSGHWSDISISSFYGSHVINCAGNGGILCVNDDEYARKAKLLRSWGRSSSLFVESESVENFRQYEKWFVLPRQTPGSYTGWLAFPLTLSSNAPFSRKELQIFLEKSNIQTRVVFTGNATRQPAFRKTPRRTSPAGYPVADSVMKGGMLLACHHGLTDAMLAHVQDRFRAFAQHYG
jgi:CDP-4-dehydro-6-deoxyglucose reductase, E1